MGYIKRALEHICRRQDEIRALNECQLSTMQRIEEASRKAKDELVTIADLINDVAEMREEAQEFNLKWKMGMETYASDMLTELRLLREQLAGTGKPNELKVQPVETSNGKTLFLVTGEELSELLTACRGAVLKMKGENHENE